jgi:hypothetical protein
MGTTFSADAPWQSGVDLGVSVFATRAVYVGGAYAFLFPVDARGQQASARVLRHPLEVIGGVELPIGLEKVRLDAELAASADWITRTTTRTAPGFAATGGTTDVAYGVGARAKLAYRPWPAFELRAGLGGDWIVRPIAYLVTAPDRVEIARPYTVRARVEGGIAVYLW